MWMLFLWFLTYLFPFLVLCWLLLDAKEKNESMLWPMGGIICPILHWVYIIKTRGILVGILIIVVLNGIYVGIYTLYLSAETSSASDRNVEYYSEYSPDVRSRVEDQIVTKSGAIVDRVAIQSMTFLGKGDQIRVNIDPRTLRSGVEPEYSEVKSVKLAQKSRGTVVDHIVWKTGNQWKDAQLLQVVWDVQEQNYKLEVVNEGRKGWYMGADTVELNYLPCPICSKSLICECKICNGSGRNMDGLGGASCTGCGGSGMISCIACNETGYIAIEPDDTAVAQADNTSD